MEFESAADFPLAASTKFDKFQRDAHIRFGSFDPAQLTASTTTPSTVTPASINEVDGSEFSEQQARKGDAVPIFQLAVGTGFCAARNARMNRQLTVRHTFIHEEEEPDEDTVMNSRPRRARSEPATPTKKSRSPERHQLPSFAFEEATLYDIPSTPRGVAVGLAPEAAAAALVEEGRRHMATLPPFKPNLTHCSPLPLVFLDAQKSVPFYQGSAMCSPPTQDGVVPTSPAASAHSTSAGEEVMPPPDAAPPCFSAGACVFHSLAQAVVPSPPPTSQPSIKIEDEVLPPPPPTSRPTLNLEDDSDSHDHVPPPPKFTPTVATARISLVECVPESSSQCQSWQPQAPSMWEPCGAPPLVDCLTDCSTQCQPWSAEPERGWEECGANWLEGTNVNASSMNGPCALMSQGWVPCHGVVWDGDSQMVVQQMCPWTSAPMCSHLDPSDVSG
eukprot:TRINITY_DN6337_c1_g3_i1.p1 TRINITY_DN6337_c1_g3~~TRINITY_DN6337_c1_g3_i1.p1  ORF type:complete len:445 (+),score=47.73 TRINITY_DN6337_c1_g3_i1:103-1437(+)